MTNPYWIDMMQESNPNYLKRKAFDLYFIKHDELAKEAEQAFQTLGTPR